MIKQDFAIIAALLFIVGAVLYISEKKSAKAFFNFMPPMFWIYFLPILLSTFNVIPQKSRVYQDISVYFLPASLLLFLISSRLKDISRLGRSALIMMLSGSLGIILGGPVVLFLLRNWLPQDIWLGFGALSASWVGGSANMLAVKEGIGAPDKIFLPMVIVDTIVPYVWMGILIALAGYQASYDRWNKSETELIGHLNEKMSGILSIKHRSLSPVSILAIFSVALAGSFISIIVAENLPVIKNVISVYTWTIILASLLGILLSFTACKKIESLGASKIGYVILYFVLASIGARANLKDMLSAPILILAGFLWVLIHAFFLFAASRLTKAPMFLIASASQANIGGTASAPVVAAAYQPSLASVGLLLAILGNIIGTYFGILCSQLCKWVYYL